MGAKFQFTFRRLENMIRSSALGHSFLGAKLLELHNFTSNKVLNLEVCKCRTGNREPNRAFKSKLKPINRDLTQFATN